MTEPAKKKINKHTLVNGCNYDYMPPSVLVKYAIDLISHAEYAEPATGHLAVYEKPEEFLKLATDFLQKS